MLLLYWLFINTPINRWVALLQPVFIFSSDRNTKDIIPPKTISIKTIIKAGTTLFFDDDWVWYLQHRLYGE